MSRDIPVDLIDPSPDQPRAHFDPDALAGLAASMAGTGLAAPILVRPAGDRYAIVHGERRWRAARLLGWATVPAEVRDIGPDEARWLALVENVQRQDLTPAEEARAYRARLAEGMTQAELGARVGKGQSYVAQKLRLLTLPDPILSYLERGAISEGHARQLLTIRRLYDADAVREVPPPHPGVSWDPADPRQATALFLAIRPEDYPPAWVVLDPREPTPEALAAGVAAFDRWAGELGWAVPSWAVAAFWWASVSVRWSFGVA